MSFVTILVGYLIHRNSRKSGVKYEYIVDTWKDKELLEMAFKRYWIANDSDPAIPQETSAILSDNLLCLVKSAAAKSDSDQVEVLLHKAIRNDLNDVCFYETVADYFFSLPDSVKYAALSSSYLLVLNRLIERQCDDGQYLLARADYYKKYEDYDAAREDYTNLMRIYPDDLWFPYAISAVYRKQDMKDASKAYLKYIKKNAPKIQIKLSAKAASGEDLALINSVMDSNNQVSALAVDMLKIKSPIKIDK